MYVPAAKPTSGQTKRNIIRKIKQVTSLNRSHGCKIILNFSLEYDILYLSTKY